MHQVWENKIIQDPGCVPYVTMTYIRGWMQMVYRHMIYSPETDKQAWQQERGTWWVDNIDNIYMHGQKTLSNPHSVHDGSSLSRLTLLPDFFLLHDAVDSFPAGSWLLILLPARGAWPFLIPPPGLTPFPLGSRQYPLPLSDTGRTVVLVSQKNMTIL
jgi:hypothetical protein